MNVEFEWTHFDRSEFTVWSCSLKGVDIGSVLQWDDDTFEVAFGNIDEPGFAPTTVDEAKAWVEQQAREWLASVTQEAARGVRASVRERASFDQAGGRKY